VYSYVSAMIEVHKLTKYFGERAAIRDLDFTIAKGEVVGFLGLNGAGKTTTLRILGCLLMPTSGTVSIDGLEVTVSPYEIRQKIGFLPDVPPLYTEMTVGAYLAFAARLRKVTGKDVAARVTEAEEKTALREVHGQVIGELSHGFRQRVGLAQAIVHKPALLILDEPSAGLDPAQIVEMRSLLRGLRGEHTVLISSHFLSEISQTCDRLLVIHNGELVGQGSEDEVAKAMGHGETTLEVEVAGDPVGIADRLTSIPGVARADKRKAAEASTVYRLATVSDVRAEIARIVVGAGWDLLRLEKNASRLESIFMDLTHKPAGGSQ
jgi:ABC-2 type transport system ATP-binding protein